MTYDQYSATLEVHIQLVEKANQSTTRDEFKSNCDVLHGFRKCLGVLGYTSQLFKCDMYYIDQGIDRPMCCGVFLDWEPEEEDLKCKH